MSDDAIRAMLSRGRLVGFEDGEGLQRVRATGFAGEEVDRVWRHQPFGFTSSPPPGSEGLLLRLGGRAERTVALGFEHPAHRPTSTPQGGTVIYDAFGNAVSLVEQSLRVVHAQEIVLKAGKIVLDSADIRLGGDDAAKPAAMQNSVDSAGHPLVSALSTAVKVK